MEQLDFERCVRFNTLRVVNFCGSWCCATIALLALWSAFPVVITAQEEETADGIELVQTLPVPTTFTEDTSQFSEDQRLVLISIRQADPIMPVPVTRSTQALLDLQLYQDVRFLLNRLDQMQLKDDQWLDVIDQTGSILFLEVFTHPNTQPEGRRVAKKVLSAARRASRNPNRIDRLISNLSSNDRSSAQSSLRQLESLGEDAVAELISKFADDQRKSEFSSIRNAIDFLGQASPEPLIGAARAKNPAVQFEAIRALSTIDDPASTEVMMWSSLAPNHPPEIKQLAQAALNKRGIGSDPNGIEQQFFTRAYRYLRGKMQAVTPLSGRVNIWSWDASTKRMTSRTVDASTATQLVAARHAVSLYDINPSSIRNRAMFVLTQLESIQRLAGPGKNIDVKQVMDRLNTNVQEIDTILAQAVRLRLYPAGVACCQIIQKNPDAALLYRYEGKPSPLIQALTSGDRYLQVAALEAIHKIDPKTGYVGSSLVLEFAVSLARSKGTPIALVADPDPNLARNYSGSVHMEDLVGSAVTSGRELFETATTTADVEVILISDKINFPSCRNLIRQLRSDWRTRETPIGLLYSDVDRGQRLVNEMESDPLFAAMPFSTTPKMIDTHLARLLTRIRPYRVTQFDRTQHAELGMKWLAEIASNRKDYRFYNIGRYEEAINDLLFQPGLEPLASKILANMGTPSAQRQLVDFASQSALPIQSRQQAMQAFSQSVKKRGNLLNAAEIQRQYDRYNASANQPKSTQELLGSILDAIEANRNR